MAMRLHRCRLSRSRAWRQAHCSAHYYSTPAVQRRQVIDILSQSLAKCGLGVNVRFSTEHLYAPARPAYCSAAEFDLIQYAMTTDAVEPPCDWFTSNEIPNNANHWVGTNVTGYQTPDTTRPATMRDWRCRANRLIRILHQTQAIFATDLPAIPLYYRLKVAASRADVCHFALGPAPILFRT